MYYEDFIVGEEQKTFGRTVTEVDIVIFATMTGAQNPLFLDEEYSKKTPFSHRIAPGLLTGQTYQLPTGPFGEGFVALLGMSFKALKPVFSGDTITTVVKVEDKQDPKEGKGRIVLESLVRNQRDELVMQIEGTFLMRVRG
ncbi:MAG: MaoC family dehydratase [Nitrososphaerales archaeon]